MRKNPEATKTLSQITYRLRSAPTVRDAQGWHVQPYKVVLETRDDRVRVVVHGRSNSRWGAGRIHFNVIGYAYPPPPAWLQELLSLNS